MKYLLMILSLFLITTSSLLAHQKPNMTPTMSAKVRTIVNNITKNGRYESERIGFAATPSEQSKHYQQLLETATVEELELLTRHASPAAKVYAFKVLLSKDRKSADYVMKRLQKDTSTIYTFEGCMINQTTVGNLITTIAQY